MMQPQGKSRVVLERVLEFLNLVERQFFGLRYTDCETHQTVVLEPTELRCINLKH